MRAREYSLTHVLFFSLTLSCLLPLLLIGSISYYSLRNLQQNSVVNSVRAAVRQNRSQIDTMVSVLDNLTQLAVMEFISAGDVERYVAARSYFDVFKAAQGIRSSVILLSFANPDIGLVFLYDAESKKIIEETSDVQEPIDFDSRPRLLHRNTFTAFGPCPTLQKDHSDLVLSAARLIPNTAGRQIYLYFEIGGRSLESILGREQYGIPATHFVLDTDGFISYSENKAVFPLGTSYKPPAGTAPWFRDRGNVVFSEPGEAGWRLMVSFQRTQFDAERTKWLAGLVIASLFSLSVSLLIALFIWRILYVPLTTLRVELDTVGGGARTQATPQLRLREYSYLMDKVDEMRVRLSANEVKTRQLEAEKLLFQINPHFLYNSLNNVQWLARINGQQEISRLVGDLNKVLHYNLRRSGEMTNVRDEIEMLQSYVAIQLGRLDLRIELALDVEPSTFDIEIPRFILQPLVENAIQHGRRDSLSIRVSVRRAADKRVHLEVRDSGGGMSAATLNDVLSRDWPGPADRPNGLGIHYVKSLITMVYGDTAELTIQSAANLGTTVSMDLPASPPGKGTS